MSDKNNSSPENSRRQFVKMSGLGLLGLSVASRLFGSGSQARAAEPPKKKLEPVKPSDPTAQALGYVEDAKKADLKKFPKRAGAAGEKQYCYNCQFYGEKKNPKASAEAACTIFAGKGVKSHGWCNSWTQDPNIKD